MRVIQAEARAPGRGDRLAREEPGAKPRQERAEESRWRSPYGPYDEASSDADAPAGPAAGTQSDGDVDGPVSGPENVNVTPNSLTPSPVSGAGAPLASP